ncbi:hypothetical protein C5K06_00460, partial [Shigella flexneri]
RKIDTGKTLTRWPVFVDHFKQPSRYGQRGQGVNGGSVKIWTGVWVKQAGCCYSTVVVTQWPTDVKNSQ